MNINWKVDYVKYQEKFNGLAQPLEGDKTVIFGDFFGKLDITIGEDKEKIFQIFEDNNPKKTPERIEGDYSSVLNTLNRRSSPKTKETIEEILKYIDSVLNNPDISPKEIKPINYGGFNLGTINHLNIKIIPKQEEKFTKRMNIAQYKKK